MDGVDSVNSQMRKWREAVSRMVAGLPTELAGACQAIYAFLDNACQRQAGETTRPPTYKHAPGGRLPEHALLTSAIAFCLHTEAMDDKLVRLAALCHQFPVELRDAIGDRIDLAQNQRQKLARAWKMIETQESTLERSRHLDNFDQEPPEDPFGRALFLAHLAASERLNNTSFRDVKGKEIETIKQRADFERHPLRQTKEKVELVYGGATKIKGYVFESARLPEVRGASTLFDRINLSDVPAMWGEQNAIARAVKAELEAPECVIFASGGNFLALAPAGYGAKLTDRVEKRYTSETLVGNSAAVWDAFNLLELQYGRQPWTYWWDDYREDLGDPGLGHLLKAYYNYPAGLAPPTPEGAYYQRKTFGELVTVLASKMMRRREGWGEDTGRRRYVPHYELLPYAVKCHSCDVRPAVIRDEMAEKEYCEACARKRIIGQMAKRVSGVEWFTDVLTDWQPHVPESWEEQFDDFLRDERNAELQENYFARGEERGLKSWSEVTAARDLHEVAAGSDPKRYVGLIYADGNNVGDRVARLTSPSEYRQFAQELLGATREAVFRALAQHLGPVFVAEANKETRRKTSAWVHPWEIITIGGDDLIVIVPGSKALEVALSIGEQLEEMLGRPGSTPSYANQRYQAFRLERGEDGHLVCLEKVAKELGYEIDISLSGGVVIAHETTPIFFLHELAEKLLKSAKAWRKKTDYQAGTVDFMALKSFGMVASRLKEFRERAYRMEDGRWLTARPYTWVELGGLLEVRRAIRDSNLGRSQVYRIRDFLLEGNRAAAVNYLYAFARLDPRQREELAAAFHLAWHGPADAPPWRHRPEDNEIETIWHDLVEIYDFVEKEA